MPTHPRFRLRTLLLWMTLLSVTLGSLVRPHSLVAASFAWCVALTVCIALLAALVCRGSDRAFWLAFGSIGLILWLFAIAGDRYSLELAMSQGIHHNSVRVVVQVSIVSLALVAGYFWRWLWGLGRQEE